MILMDFLVCHEEISSKEEDRSALNPETTLRITFMRKQNGTASHFDIRKQ